MSPLVVLLALAAVATASPSLLYGPLAQPPNHPAVVLDPHGRPLDTAEVINARALHLQAKALEHSPLVYAASPVAHSVYAAAPVAHSVYAAAPVAHSVYAAAPVAHSVYAAPAAVSHQSRVDIHSSPALLAHSVVAPISYSAHGLSAHGLSGHSLWKRSLGHLAYASVPVAHTVYAAPSAVSHQSRVDVHSSPAVVSHAVAYAAPIAHPVAALYAAPAAVSHQSRVDIHSSPAVLAHSVYSPVSYSAHGLYAQGLSAHGLSGHGLSGHSLWKRSLGHLVYAAPSAVSHQSRVDVHSSPALVSHAYAAAPAAYYSAPVAHPVAAVYAAPAAVSHQSRVDVRSSPALVSHAYAASPLALTQSAYSTPLLHHSW